MEEPQHRNNPIPFLLLATGMGALLGSWWIGLLVGIGMTVIPGIAVIALLINNLLLQIPLLIGFPFYLAFLAVRRLVRGRRSDDDEVSDLS